LIAPSEVVLLTTCRDRPAYFTQALGSWTRVRGAGQLAALVVALGHSDVEAEMAALAAAAAQTMGLPLEVLPDSPAAQRSPGMHRALGEAILWIRANLRPKAVILTEEDLEVSDDTAECLLWALNRFEDDPDVLTACAHEASGQGWHQPGAGPRGRDNPQDVMVLAEDFNPWVWATWETRLDFLLDQWDWDATTGPHPARRGYDWQIRRLVRGLTSVMPLASRSQNLGRDGGVYAHPDRYEDTLAASYRPHRDPVGYRLENEGHDG
jgi:hypothetical protein